jgi:hypothetical protein
VTRTVVAGVGWRGARAAHRVAGEEGRGVEGGAAWGHKDVEGTRAVAALTLLERWVRGGHGRQRVRARQAAWDGHVKRKHPC